MRISSPTTRRIGAKSRRAALALLCASALGGCLGCLGKPEIEDRWTRLDVLSSTLRPGQTLAAGSSQPITVRTAITYRSILTGFAVTELRASASVSAADVRLDPDAPRVPMASAIDSILRASVSRGRATRAVTGWDHLIQEIDFGFVGSVPAATDSSGRPLGLFLISYLAEGVEVRREDGSDSLIVTPLESTRYQILPVGIELAISGGGP
jgi:hypothetical protein